MSIRTTENANCFECRKAPHSLEVGGNNLCPVRELVAERSKLESHVCPMFLPLEALARKREIKQQKRQNEMAMEPLF